MFVGSLVVEVRKRRVLVAEGRALFLFPVVLLERSSISGFQTLVELGPYPGLGLFLCRKRSVAEAQPNKRHALGIPQILVYVAGYH